MDIHRCRFVPIPPSTINALAFTHSFLSRKQKQKAAPPRLAIGRANGDIEIWNPLKGSWLQETIIRGGKGRSIDGLVWTRDPNEEVNGRTLIGKSRLFSIGYTTTVTEWDLTSGKPLRQVSGNHGEIWCIAAQPFLAPIEAETNSAVWPGQNLVAGCTDGAMVLYSTKDEDLQLQRLMVRPSSKSAKIISVTFQGRNIVVAGCTDSKIRIYDIRNGSLIRTMSLGAGPKGGPKEIIVWSMKVLKDGTIISGDSTGEVKIWDGKTYTLKQRIQSHKQDVLSLATNNDGTAFFSGGMDRRTVVYKPVGKLKRWAEVKHQRFHNHDVKAMASFEDNGMSVIVSGGPDASPTVIPLAQFGFEVQRTLPFLSQQTCLGSSPQKRLMMSWWDREVHIWRLGKAAQPDPENEENEDEQSTRNRKLVAKILIKGEANITSATLIEDGSILAVATNSDIKIFHLTPRKPAEGDSLKITKITVPASSSTGARLVQFSPDGKWLSVIRPDSQINLLRITSSPSSISSPLTIIPHSNKLARIDRKVEKLALLGGLGAYDRTITQLAFSADSKILAVSDLAGYVDTFILSGIEDPTQPMSRPSKAASSSDEDSDEEPYSEDEEKLKPRLIFGQCWTRNPSASLIPRLPCSPVVLSFRPAATKPLTNGNPPTPTKASKPTTEDRLLIITATNDMLEFEVLKGGLSNWSRQNPPSCFPSEWKISTEPIKGVVWDVRDQKERVWVYSINRLSMFDLSKDFPDVSGGGRKRKREGTGAGGRVVDKRLGMGIGRKVKRVVFEEGEQEESIFGGDAMDVDEDEEGDEQDFELERLRKEGDANDKSGEEARLAYTTLGYRPIMGVVVIGAGEAQGGEDFGPEVALVERPAWDLELGPRFYGDQEWREKDNMEQL